MTLDQGPTTPVEAFIKTTPNGSRILGEIPTTMLERIPAHDRTTIEGFHIGGDNETGLIASLTSIEEVPLSTIEANLHIEPGSLKPKLIQDNDTVHKMDRTHQDMEAFLNYFPRAQHVVGQAKLEIPYVLEYNGRQFIYRTSTYRHPSYSAFNPTQGTGSTSDILTSLTDGRQLHYSALEAYEIENYGYYGNNNPSEIAEIAGFIETSADDPVATYMRNRNAPVRFTTVDHLQRVTNLVNAGYTIFDGPGVEIAPENMTDTITLFANLQRTDRKTDRLTPRSQMLMETAASKINPEHISTEPVVVSRTIRSLLERGELLPPTIQTLIMDHVSRFIPDPDDERAAILFFEDIKIARDESLEAEDSEAHIYYEKLLGKMNPADFVDRRAQEAQLRAEKVRVQQEEANRAYREQQAEKLKVAEEKTRSLIEQLPKDFSEEAKAATEELLVKELTPSTLGSTLNLDGLLTRLQNVDDAANATTKTVSIAYLATKLDTSPTVPKEKAAQATALLQHPVFDVVLDTKDPISRVKVRINQDELEKLPAEKPEYATPYHVFEVDEREFRIRSTAGDLYSVGDGTKTLFSLNRGSMQVSRY